MATRIEFYDKLPQQIYGIDVGTAHLTKMSDGELLYVRDVEQMLRS